MEQSAELKLELPDNVIALIPMRNVVLFPHVLMPKCRAGFRAGK